MAEEMTLLEKYLTCFVCTETFTDPVSLGCDHSFCSNCLQKFWDQATNKNCPICRRKSSNDNPRVNVALKGLADSYTRTRTGSPESDEADVVCRKHAADLIWFCKDEQRAVCHICEFPHHRGHEVVPIEQGVSDLKEQLKTDLKSLQDKKDKYKEIQKTYDGMLQHSKKQLVNTERQITAEFDNLRQFLKEEEEARVEALRGEEEQKRRTIILESNNIQKQISSLSERISAVEQVMEKASVSFLTGYKHTQSSARAHCSQPDPHILPGGLIDVAKHLGNLSYRVWEKVKDRVKFTPVILDPNTASASLCLSDDLTSVRKLDKYQNLPDNPERFTKYAEVMGSEGFSSGKHSWEVEVGDHPNWTIGVAKESVVRNAECTDSPKWGIWCLCYRNEKYTNASGKIITLKRIPQRIRVQLDYERGEVSFYDPEDKTHIYTHQDTFTEKIYPKFSCGSAGKSKTVTVTSIKVCPTEACE